ncbi:hypothetical protein XELAEV_18016817mg [Xenopus laevis]|uniref:Uncharacterized protein n=1 Tax=Xenopus laevis TaxID=8355 RepID=A0A974HS26_XENLA|nr:hypothetical protein XELAEV_18016817mg [Xenopus laevis]
MTHLYYTLPLPQPIFTILSPYHNPSLLYSPPTTTHLYYTLPLQRPIFPIHSNYHDPSFQYTPATMTRAGLGVKSSPGKKKIKAAHM